MPKSLADHIYGEPTTPASVADASEGQAEAKQSLSGEPKQTLSTLLSQPKQVLSLCLASEPEPKQSLSTLLSQSEPKQEAKQSLSTNPNVFRESGQRGGIARRAALTPERRSEIARMGARAKAAKRKPKQQIGFAPESPTYFQHE